MTSRKMVGVTVLGIAGTGGWPDLSPKRKVQLWIESMQEILGHVRRKQIALDRVSVWIPSGSSTFTLIYTPVVSKMLEQWMWEKWQEGVTSHQVEKASIYTFTHSIKIWHMSGIVCGLCRVYIPVSKNKLISNSDKYNGKKKNHQKPQTNPVMWMRAMGLSRKINRRTIFVLRDQRRPLQGVAIQKLRRNQSCMEMEVECSRRREQPVRRWKGVCLHVPAIKGHPEWGEAGEASQVRGSQVRQRRAYHGKEFGFYSIDTCSFRASDRSSPCTFSLSYPVTTAGSKDEKPWEHSSTSGENINWQHHFGQQST